MFKRRFMWQAQWILHVVNSESRAWILQQFQKRWQAWDI
jgi:hypothetical protein